MACRYLHRGVTACASIALAGATAACDFGDDNAAGDAGNLVLDGSLGFDATGGTGPGPASEAGSATADATVPDAGPLAWDGGPPAPGTCVPTGSMIVPRSLFSVTPLRDGRVLVSGGETLTADIYDPTTGTFSAAAPPTHFFFNYPNGLIPLPDGT